MEFLKAHIGAEYNDYNGLVSLDFNDGTDLSALCRDHGLSLEGRFPIGLRISEFTTQGIGRSKGLFITVYTVNTAAYGNSAAEVSENIAKRGGTVEVEGHQVRIPYKDLGNYIKRFDLWAVGGVRSGIQNMKIREV